MTMNKIKNKRKTLRLLLKIVFISIRQMANTLMKNRSFWLCSQYNNFKIKKIIRCFLTNFLKDLIRIRIIILILLSSKNSCLNLKTTILIRMNCKHYLMAFLLKTSKEFHMKISSNIFPFINELII